MKKKFLSMVAGIMVSLAMVMTSACNFSDDSIQSSNHKSDSDISQSQSEEDASRSDSQTSQSQPDEDSSQSEMDSSQSDESSDKEVGSNVDFNVAYFNVNMKRQFGWRKIYYDGKRVDSLDEWKNIYNLVSNDFRPDYDEEFFKEKSLIVYVQQSSGGGTEEGVEIYIEDKIATIKVGVWCGILDYISEWALVIEVNKRDFESVRAILLERNFHD